MTFKTRYTTDGELRPFAIARDANAALAQNRDVLELRRIEVQMVQAQASAKWNGVLPTQMYAGAPVPFLNVGTPLK